MDISALPSAFKTSMRHIDPSDPIYKGLTKAELKAMPKLSNYDKESLSMVLFGESLYGPPTLEKQIEKRWAALLGETATIGTPYKFNRVALNKKLEKRKVDSKVVSSLRTATVSAFADWVLRLYISEPNLYALDEGKIGERSVVDRREQIRCVRHEIPRWDYRRWKLLHDGVRRPFEKVFSIPSLTVNGEALRGVPDLVFRERKTGRILIVELKVTSAELPSDGWPNLRAQLWAYGHIKEWATAPEILLAGEVWSNQFSEPIRRQTYFWNSNDKLLNEECLELFTAYGGKFEG